jgi:hypothetical protein
MRRVVAVIALLLSAAPAVLSRQAMQGSSLTSQGPDPGLISVPIPETVPEMLAQLRVRDEEIKGFIDRGAFANVYVPAFQAKDLALALDEHKKDLPVERQQTAEPAIARLVRYAYILDAFGDLGNRQQIVEAYDRFTVAVKDIETAFGAADTSSAKGKTPR